MAWFIGQSLVFIVVAFVVGVLVGWLWWGRRRPAPAVAADGPTAVLAHSGPARSGPARSGPAMPEEPTAALPIPEQVASEEPTAVLMPVAPLRAPVEFEADDEPTGVIPVAAEPEPEPVDEDLERIEGIGPKMAAALRAAGIRRYAALADSDEETLRTAVEKAGLNFAPSLVTWARQARLLADGDEEGFADLTRRLVAGRDTGRV